MPIHPLPNILSHKDPFFGLRILQPNEDPSLPPKRILNYKDGTELVYIPPGPFMMGDEELNKESNDCPRHEVYLDGFYMAVWPVTNKQYRRFMWETGHRAPDVGFFKNRGSLKERVWRGNQMLAQYKEHPVVCVLWKDAEAYGRWSQLRLPTEAEWEKAAGGPGGLKYPWGNEWEGGRCRNECNRGAGTTSEVKEYVSGVSGYGCEQMSGNVLEWCKDLYGQEFYSEGKGRNPTGPEDGWRRVSRGGAWCYAEVLSQVAYRFQRDPGGPYDFLGFRLARSFPLPVT